VKTNHQRGFVEPITPYVGSHRDGTRLRTDPEFGGSVTYADGTVKYFRGGSRWRKAFGETVKIGDTIIQVGAIAHLDETTNGKRGVAKRLRGAKKFVRTRIRAKAKKFVRTRIRAKAKEATRKLEFEEAP
jgi:hypothetical protein